ncbi:sensor histidine kinase [Nonomuraea gerenzanensis]|uniref:histidine kinase n=1 Tax=Nonomuraea gerenzanensis TaxID=93944 RepID=A0A1M4DWQ8_9ACTN|nr:sensor histidine kinase [Nonomuraea gerenzanensis]UBU13334.1 sensor histidine kinase [Nonomuraea gerenzanensis]SBO90990.1 two-component system sensor kinase [Nonomuraea gerenzanensis]
MSFVPGWRSFALDGVLAAVVAALLSLTVLATPAAGVLDLVAVLIAAASLVLWRRAPLVSLPISTACMLVYAVHAQPGPPAAFPVLVSVYGAARAGHRLLPALAGLVFLGSSLAAGLSGATGADQEQQVFQGTTLLLGWFLAAGVAGTVSMHRQAYLEQAEQRAAEAERTREEVARRRAGEERLRIARELHDSLTHSISVIKVQAGVAVHLARKRGEEVPASLLAIQEASGDAMRELRTTLELLRDTGDEGGAAGPSGLDRLGDLVERARSTGLPATVTVSGTRRELPAEVDRAAYRIVQEALTNVSRHAGAAAATVRIDYGGQELVVQVDDDGAATRAAPPVPGVGLLGMRERVTALGGRLLAEPRAEGGFTVRAELPLGGPS